MEALKYDTRNDFMLKSSGAYNFASKRLSLDIVCAHMEYKKETRYKCTKIAVKIEEKIEQLKKADKANKLVVNKKVDTISTNITIYENIIDSTEAMMFIKEIVQSEALKYNTVKQFNKESKTIFKFASKHNLLNTVCSHMVKDGWNEESVREEALKYKTRSEFAKGSSGAYAHAHKNNYIDAICSHMKTVILWNEESVREEALKYKTKAEFVSGSSGAYAYATKNKLLDDICSHMVVLINNEYHPVIPRKEWSFGSLKEEALKYSSKTEFGEKSGSAYRAALKNNYIDVVCSHMPTNKLWSKWTVETIKEEALKYNTKGEFSKGCMAAYQQAKRSNIFEEVCAHMIPLRTLWTEELVQLEALKYKSKTEFFNNASSAVNYAKKHKIYNMVCSHMIPRYAK